MLSDRSLCYLASGKPVVVQHTGQSKILPDMEGLFRFHTVKEAAQALATASSAYDYHCRRARVVRGILQHGKSHPKVIGKSVGVSRPSIIQKLRIVTTGLAATYPFGGVFWDYMQYPLGFHRLGHEVLYLEDTGKWSYNPGLATFQQDGESNAAYLAKSISRLDSDLAERWCFRDATGRTYGRSWSDVVEFCRSADLFIHISGSCWMRDEHLAAKRVILLTPIRCTRRPP